NYQAVVAHKINDHVSLGVALNVYASDTDLERRIPFSLLFPGAKDGRFSFDGSGEAAGATVGLLWTINRQNSIGVVYRSPFAIDYHGTAVVRNDPTGNLGRSSASAEITFPQEVAVGYAFRPIE